MFDITKCPIIDGYKRCKTRDGRNVRIVCEDRLYDGHPIVALIESPKGEESVLLYRSNGKFSVMEYHLNNSDLINIPIKKTLWVNVHPDGNTYVYGDKQWAEDGIPRNRLVARVKVEYEEGQFDE